MTRWTACRLPSCWSGERSPESQPLDGRLRNYRALVFVCVLLSGCVGRALYPGAPEMRIELEIIEAGAAGLTVEVESDGVRMVHSVPEDGVVPVVLPAERRGCRPVFVFAGANSPRTVVRVRSGRETKAVFTRAELESLVEHGGVPVQLPIE